MSARALRWTRLIVIALPTSVGTFTTQLARAQSIPPLRQSLPPRLVASLPPPRNRRLAASDADPPVSRVELASLAEAETVAGDEQAPVSSTVSIQLAQVSGTTDAPPAPAEAEAEAGAAGASPAAAGADDTGPKPEPGYLEGAYLTTDWGGSRSWLLEHGVDVAARYTAEGFTRLRGGTGTKNPRTYLGSFVASVDVDTGALGAWKGGAFHAHMQAIHGGGFTERHLGTIQSASNLEAAPFATLAEYWYRQEFFDRRLAFKIGKQDGNVDFAASDYSGSLLDSSFGVFPTLALTTYPNWGLGVAAFVSPTEWLTVQSAVYDGAPNGKKPLGGTTMFEGNSGHLVVGEMQLHLQPLMGGAGTVRVGGWYHTAETAALPSSANDNADTPFSHNYGLYGVVDRKLYQPAGKEREKEGLGIFLQLGGAPQDRNESRMYLGGGLAYTGAIPGRPGDVVAGGFGHVDLARSIKHLEGRTSETVFELTYKAQVTGAVSVQPDAQYFVRPSGDGGVPNAVVLGIRIVATL